MKGSVLRSPANEVAAPPPAGGAKLQGYEVLICVTGGIAAYKSAVVVSQLVQAGAGVTVAMTRNARRFVGPLTFQALSGRTVLQSLWREVAPGQINHLRASEIADLCLVAPATANCLGKLAGGIADDLVSSMLLGLNCPVLLAPAMNERMWQHPAVQRNVGFLREQGFAFVGPEAGWQACRAVGPGRMSEPEALLAAVREQLRTAAPRSSSKVVS